MQCGKGTEAGFWCHRPGLRSLVCHKLTMKILKEVTHTSGRVLRIKASNHHPLGAVVWKPASMSTRVWHTLQGTHEAITDDSLQLFTVKSKYVSGRYLLRTNPKWGLLLRNTRCAEQRICDITGKHVTETKDCMSRGRECELGDRKTLEAPALPVHSGVCPECDSMVWIALPPGRPGWTGQSEPEDVTEGPAPYRETSAESPGNSIAPEA